MIHKIKVLKHLSFSDILNACAKFFSFIAFIMHNFPDKLNM